MRVKKILALICIFALVTCEGKDDFHTRTRVPRQRDKTTLGTYAPNLESERNNAGMVSGICPSVDVRNSLDNLNGIRDCIVIEGFLQIIRINDTDADKIGNLTFPKLREITGYLLLYEVSGLRSLTNLFPNLEVIRGHHLITGYALMVYGMPNLQELGLKKVTEITRAGVRIENNPSLCYVDTVNWNLIVPDGEIFVNRNKADGSCPGCSQCDSGHCWTSSQCQDTVRPRCHVECLGLCHGLEDTDCNVCKHYRHGEKCMAECPTLLYGYLSRRCVTREECLTMDITGLQNDHGSTETPIWRPFNGSCIRQCPYGFEDHVDSNNGLTCRKCSGPCQRVIGNTSDAQLYGRVDVDQDGPEFHGRNIPNELIHLLSPNKEVVSYSVNQGDKNVATKSSRQPSKDQDTSGKSKLHDIKNRPRYAGPKEAVVTADGICTSADVRNSVENFERIQDCVIIEGFLQIVLITNDHTTESAFENVTLPKLREITGYLLLYRVNGLKSLTNLFPNLEVIRGQDLLTDYALMVYEMPNLQELGLTKLVEISRGGVRIEKNPTLCYLETVNWNSIVSAGTIFIKYNKPQKMCPGCQKCTSNYCWTSQHCQATVPTQCHSECLGLCFGIEDTACHVCKNYRHGGKCIPKCPEHLYGYLSRRCITQAECVKMKRPSPPNGYGVIPAPSWRPFNGSCITQCPIGYEDYVGPDNITTCKKCAGECRQVLGGEIIRNMADAQRYRGKNVIQGGLEFHISNGNRNIMSELADSFGDVEEITGYLKVMHSFPITSLSFFKKLRVINGEQPDSSDATLTVLDNPNLSNLFAKGQKIEIKRGRMFFHYNPKLCISKIDELGRMAGIINFSKVEVDPESNGERVACDIVEINITVSQSEPNLATVVWNNYVPSDGQMLLGYVLNYMATENRNITVFESNFCGNNTWQTIDVDVPISNASSSTMVSKTITGLKPYTSYAIYVKTYTSRTENPFTRPVGQSIITFFRTRSDVPSPPTNVSSSAATDTEIMVRWGPPETPNGPIAYYLVSGFLRGDDRELLELRDYCTYRITDENVESDADIAVTDSYVTDADVSDNNGTDIDITDIDFRDIDITDVDALEKIELKLQSAKKKCCKKKLAPVKPAPPKEFEIMCHENMSLGMFVPSQKSSCRSPAISESEPVINDGVIEVFFFNVSADNNSFLVKNLTHYSMYTISIEACGTKHENGTEQCSDIRYTSTRTAKQEAADDVRNVEARVWNGTTVTVSWDAVEYPNGLTVSYTVEYTNLDVKHFVTASECVRGTTIRQDRMKRDIKDLIPGRYHVRVRSTSLAGDGNFSNTVQFQIQVQENNSTGVIIVLGLAIFAAAVIFGLCIFLKRRSNKMKQIRLIASVNPEYIETKYVIDDWEVAREDVEILEELGLGNFGMVYRGILNGSRNVAIKTISETANLREKNEFLNEASVMKNFATFHIIKLLGVVSVGSPPFVIMELMENGDLKTYLRKTRDTNLVPNFSRICRMAAEIADGMAYLESKKFVHRDLAARNCMVSKDLVCKIGDFGMARDIYETDYYKIGKKGLLPIRWMAPENLSDGVFTSDSDVWSYGVVLYEILTLAEIPYQGFSNEEVLNYVLRKGTVDIPKNCPEVIYKIMERCFKWRPNDRPTFLEICAELEPFLSQDFCTASFYHSSEGVEIRNSGVKKVYHNAAPIRFYFGNETARWVKDFEDNVMLLDQTKAGSSRGRIFKNGFQHFGNLSAMEDVSLDR